MRAASATPARANYCFLIPLFAIAWGWLFLGESVTPAMGVGGLVILVGTGLATGVLKLPSRAAVKRPT